MTFFNDPVVLNGGKALVAVLMILSNSILVFVTYKTKALNSTCNWLIAANSACIALYSLTYFVQFGIVLLRPSGIPLWQCCLLVPVPLFFLCCQYVLFPLIALDRLIGAIFPLKQMGNRYKHRYMFFALVASTSFGLFIVAASVNKSIIHFSENLVFCMTSDPAPAYFANCSWALNITSAILYLALWVRIKLLSSCVSQKTKFNDAVTRKVLFSLMVICLVEMCGWVSNWTLKLVLNQFDVTALTQWYVLSYFGFVMELTLALNAPILYALSSEYRKAFRAVLEQIGKTSQQPAKALFVVPTKRKNGKTNDGNTI
uniref:G-protein coupled receptors family 1 profile domain-containing protein n=1 Tax=Globodera rostochiensis TaxID=31243 RepID=A0A914IAM5_GLORO